MMTRQAGFPSAPESERLFARAQRSLVGGVNSPVRGFRAVGGSPRFVVRGQGPWIEDCDGHRYIDYCGSWGALLHGHAHPAIVRAIREAALRGTSFGAATEAEVHLAESVKAFVPSIDLLRFVNSGTEATMSAIRVARAATSRDRILMFEGSYHGHADPFLVRAGSGMAAAESASSTGVPHGAIQDTLTAPYNDLAAVDEIFRRHGPSMAAVLVEPVAGNMGVVPPDPDFLRGLRDLTNTHGSLLIFDEVITGFRLAPGGAQERYGAKPDLTCFGKILGHGLPVGAYGGRRDVMELVAPLGPVYQAGTLAGNPLAMAAGRVALSRLNNRLYASLERRGTALEHGIADAGKAARVPIRVQRVGSMLGLFFTELAVRNFADARTSNHGVYGRLFWSLLSRGVYLPPAPFESLFVSASHRTEDIDRTIEAFHGAFRELAG